MEAMVLPLDYVEVPSFAQYGPWHLRDLPSAHDHVVELGEPLNSKADLSAFKHRLPQHTAAMKHYLPTPKSTAEAAAAAKQTTSTSPLPSIASPGVSQAGGSGALLAAELPRPGRSAAAPSASQTNQPCEETALLSTWTPSLTERPRKRRRPDSDVDGPNTAAFGCKKRRLLRHLITSRLSQPFSLPATHILNREAVANGDRRFLKLAAIMAARKLTSAVHPSGQRHHGNQWSLRRAAMVNRFRLRARHEASERSDADAERFTANAALLQLSHGVYHAGSRFPVTPGGLQVVHTAPSSRVPPHFKPPTHYPLHPISKAGARPATPTSPSGPRPVDPVASSLRLPPSPKLRPLQSPELRSSRLAADLDDDDLDDDVMSFPSSDLDGKYEASDDHDDVYSDFGAIFGGGSDGEGSDEDGDHYEEYMDDLDGIPWSVRGS